MRRGGAAVWQCAEDNVLLALVYLQAGKRFSGFAKFLASSFVVHPLFSVIPSFGTKVVLVQ